MTQFQRIIDNKNISKEYLAGVCGVRVSDLETWAQTGKIPELYGPTLAKILDVELNELYKKDVEFSSSSVENLQMPQSPIHFNDTVGSL